MKLEFDIKNIELIVIQALYKGGPDCQCNFKIRAACLPKVKISYRGKMLIINIW